MQTMSRELRAPLGFSRADDVAPDEERPGLLRARTIPGGGRTADALDFRSCVLHDCATGASPDAGLEEVGFEAVDLSANAALQAALGTVRDEDRISEASQEAVRESLAGARFPLASGTVLRIETVAADGMIHRRGGPNGLDVNPEGMQGGNGHGAAQGIHGDQDVLGTPLAQLMNGAAPDLFRHRTPDCVNEDAGLFLLNLWVPIQQITRPLVLMDRRTLDAKRHQLRYGLPVTGFLDRDQETRINDIWSFLHDPGQVWYFRSRMGPGQAYLFDTLGEPHGSCILPGEDALEELWHALGRACAAAAEPDADALAAIGATAPPELPEVTTEPIREAWHAMTKLLREAEAHAGAVCTAPADWVGRARAAMDAVIRKSLEMRLVASVVAD